MSIFIWLLTIFCCTYSQARPQQNNAVPTRKVNINELFLQIYTRADPIGTRVNLTNGSDVANLSSFNTNLETFIYIHGWEDTISKPNPILIKDSLLKASDANVLLLSWDKCANNNYLVSFGCVEGTGNYLGEFLKAVQESYSYTLDNVTLIGHSLGAHIAGYAGKNTNGTLGVIVGLDPAGPLFSQHDKKHRLCETDAQYVQAIHTCATGIVGVIYSLADTDFWPNRGVQQPGCGQDILGCPHLRAVEYYAESLSSDDFVGYNCNNYQDYKNGKCENGAKNVMGGHVDKEGKGNYYLDTNDKSPFAKGDV